MNALDSIFHARIILNMAQKNKLQVLELLLRILKLIFDVKFKNSLGVVLDFPHIGIL
jgi:hypothetical protein